MVSFVLLYIVIMGSSTCTVAEICQRSQVLQVAPSGLLVGFIVALGETWFFVSLRFCGVKY
jgi:hypothetical protein